MASIIRIYSYYGEPMAEINTAEGFGRLETRWPLSEPRFDAPHRPYAFFEVTEQKMLNPALQWHLSEAT